MTMRIPSPAHQVPVLEQRVSADAAIPARSGRRAPRRSGVGARLWIWVLALATAESVGMLAAATASRAATSRFGEAPRGADAVGAIGVVVAGGLVEAAGLAIATALLLGRHVPELRRLRLAMVTVVVGASGWALGSVPGVLGSTGVAPVPPWWWVLGAGAVLGAATGGLLGAAQSFVLRGSVPHPARWALASAAGWSGAMAIIMVAATAPEPGTPMLSVLGLAAAAGAVAGAALGVVLGTAALTLNGASFTSTVLAQLLRGPARAVLGQHLVVLRVRGRVTGRLREVPVRVARDQDGWVVLVARASRKRWWRNLRRPAPVDVLYRGVWWSTTGEVVASGSSDAVQARMTYLQAHPGAHPRADEVLVRLSWP